MPSLTTKMLVDRMEKCIYTYGYMLWYGFNENSFNEAFSIFKKDHPEISLFNPYTPRIIFDVSSIDRLVHISSDMAEVFMEGSKISICYLETEMLHKSEFKELCKKSNRFDLLLQME